MFSNNHIECHLWSKGRDCFPGGQNIYLLFNFDIVNSLLKTYGGRERRPNFVNIVVWGALTVGWVVVVRSRKSYLGPAKVASFVFYSRMGTKGE